MRLILYGALCLILLGIGCKSEPAPEIVNTPVDTIAPTVEVPTVTAVEVEKPTPTPVPTPVATKVPSSLPTPQAALEAGKYVYDQFGFVMRLDDEVNITATGISKDSPDASQGLLVFSYKGTAAFVLWAEDPAATPDAMLAETYNTLRLIQPGYVFLPITEGDISVGDLDGKFGGFGLTDSSGKSLGGGLMGSWVCPDTSTAMGLTVIGVKATTLQIRFNRLLQLIEC
jgi:hypothetical protein